MSKSEQKIGALKLFPWGDHHRAMLAPSEWELLARATSLTPMELNVCQWLFKGLTRTEIASNLGVKPRTIRQHMEQIHQKLRVHNRVCVVLRIIQIRDWLRRENRARTSDAD